jgi:cell division protein FtsN
MKTSFVLILALASVVRAQDSTAKAPVVQPPVDSVLQRATQLVGEGHAAEGRALVDSVLAVTPQGTPQYAEVLFTKASLAATAFETERDYRRVTVEYPSSPRSDDALLRLAQLELARGDKDEAKQHLMRLDRDRPASETPPRTNLSIAHAWFEIGDPTHACAALAAAHATTPSAQVELIHQLDYAAQPCADLPPPTTVATQPPSAAQPPSATQPPPAIQSPSATQPSPATQPPPATHPSPAATTAVAAAAAPTPPIPSAPAPAPSTPSPAPAPARSLPKPTSVAKPTTTAATVRGGYTVQVAAYDTRAAAEDLAARLRGRGYDVRVWGTAAPYRVRIGRYATRGAAERELSDLKSKQMTGFVAEAEPSN